MILSSFYYCFPQLNLYLENWDLYGNMIDDDGVSVLIEHLPVFPSLTYIDVYNSMYDNISQGNLTTLEENL